MERTQVEVSWDSVSEEFRYREVRHEGDEIARWISGSRAMKLVGPLRLATAMHATTDGKRSLA